MGCIVLFIKSLKLNIKLILFSITITLVLLFSIILFYSFAEDNQTENNSSNKNFIKWVDFNVTSEALKLTSDLDISSHKTDSPIKYNWIELLAYLACQNGGNFKNFKKADLDYLISRLNNGETMDDLTCDMKFYDYYYEAYSAVLSGFIGNYSIEVESSSRY